ncbi:MAG: hypothetical protein ACPL5F_04310 [Moorellaceae bacterium]
MHWREKIRAVLRLNEEEISLWSRIAASEPNPAVRSIIQMMVEHEKQEMEQLRCLLNEYGGGYKDPPPYMEPPGY